MKNFLFRDNQKNILNQGNCLTENSQNQCMVLLVIATKKDTEEK